MAVRLRARDLLRWLLSLCALALLIVRRPGLSVSARGPSQVRPPRRASSPQRGARWLTASSTLAAILVAGGFELVHALDEHERFTVAVALTGGVPRRGPALIRRYGCAGCHTIPGVAGADGKAAPPLGHLRERVFIGGVARHSPEMLVRWIVAPQSISPHSAMPATGISESEARDVAAFLYAQ